MIEFKNLIVISVLIYLCIGILLVVFGPAGKFVSEEVKRVKGSPLLNEINEREAPSKKKIMLLQVLLYGSMVLLWIIFIWGVFKEERIRKEVEKEMERKSTGLWFDRMGGSGKIHCAECTHTESVTSFIHGIDASYSGHQCQSCGIIKTLTGGGRGRANQYKESMTCECGGKFERDEMLFCPQCKSKNLEYDLEYIT